MKVGNKVKFKKDARLTADSTKVDLKYVTRRSYIIRSIGKDYVELIDARQDNDFITIFHNEGIVAIFNALELVGDSLSPHNNDGRDICYWCEIPTQKRGNGAYDICPRCGK